MPQKLGTKLYKIIYKLMSSPLHSGSSHDFCFWIVLVSFVYEGGKNGMHVSTEKNLFSPFSFCYFAKDKMSHFMRKPVYAICEQQRRRSACASTQSEQRFCFYCLDSIISLVSIAEISSP